MGVRIGVDVGGTFTKAVGIDTVTGALAARAAVLTTHDDRAGSAAGVVEVVSQVAAVVGAAQIELITYSTTQAVNALLEGDVAVVGVLGMGRQPDLRRAAQRTRLDKVELAPGRRLPTVIEFLDITHGLDDTALAAALDRLCAGGATTICVAEAFATDGGRDERRAVEAAIDRGLPACGSSEMTGLYGLELRAVTAALNASVLPIAMRTEQHVEAGVAAAGIHAPVMVMRGDGGATDPAGLRREPARALYSGPAASVAGVLRHTRVAEGIVIEVGGTSSNVAAIKDGQPALSYVRVASHATAVRALDVRVIGVAGGSLIRVRKGRLYGVGPRSAHIAGLPYCCYQPAPALVGAVAMLYAPRPEDPAECLVLKLTDGTAVALTVTCAAVALGVVQPGDYAGEHADGEAARAGFAIAGPQVKMSGDDLARHVLNTAADAVGALTLSVAHEYGLSAPTLVAVGGGAGGLGRQVAARLGLRLHVPDLAEVISAVGDALSLVRVERERSITNPQPSDQAALAREATEAAVAAGAAADSIDVRIELDGDRAALRAVATGMVGLAAGALPGRSPIDAGEAAAITAELGAAAPVAVGRFWVATGTDDKPVAQRPTVVLDRFGDPVVAGRGGVLPAAGGTGAEDLVALVGQATRRRGFVSTLPKAWLIQDTRATEVAARDLAAAVAAIDPDAGPAVAVVICP